MELLKFCSPRLRFSLRFARRLKGVESSIRDLLSERRGPVWLHHHRPTHIHTDIHLVLERRR